MKVAVFTIFLMCFGTLLKADPPDEILQQSTQFANVAENMIEQGDRHGAIVAALKGLPADPDAATLASFEIAHDMLFRAMAARVVNVDRQSGQAYAVNIDGTRAVVMGINQTMISMGSLSPTIEFDPDTRIMVSRGGPEFLPLDQEPPHILVDPRTGEIIADLMPFGALQDAGWGPAFPPAFSPDGKTVAAWHMADGVVLRFDTTDGNQLSSLDDMAGRQPGNVIGYSPDGTLIAASADGLATIWDAETGDLIEILDMPDNTMSADWTFDNALLTLQVSGFGEDDDVSLSIYRDGRWDKVMSLTGRTADRPTQYMQVAKTGPLVLPSC
jgi:hypothetical protein